jgi:hypothetical protein
MRRILFGSFLITVLISAYSCSGSGPDASDDKNINSAMVKQQADGTIALKLDKAVCYNSDRDPSCNTAEWNFEVSKPGRYYVWLSSATKDTMNLQYPKSVRINVNDELLEAKPVGDKIVLNATDVKYPYYRADSYMGSVIIQEPGEYSIQVISEKVVSGKVKTAKAENDNNTKMMSVILTPISR